MIKLLTVIGARPQFIKAGIMSKAIASWNASNNNTKFSDIIIHTGQHFDNDMSDIFFSEFGMPKPLCNLGISGQTHGIMTGRMMEALDPLLLDIKPDCLLVYGDTNSTLAAALSAAKLHIPVMHVEAGLRSFNKSMPEEINRILTDQVSSLLFCPTVASVQNLKKEGFDDDTIFNVGDVMYDASILFKEIAQKRSNILDTLGLKNKEYILATCHRASNIENPQILRSILNGLISLHSKFMSVVFPIHPRTKKLAQEYGFEDLLSKILTISPLSYTDMTMLESCAKLIVTDSGGVQKEAYFYKVPCITVREETEWIETLEFSANRLCSIIKDDIYDVAINLVDNDLSNIEFKEFYGKGDACTQILEHVIHFLKRR